MKKHLIIITLLSMLMFAGCTKYERDRSYETDLYGIYTKCIDFPNKANYKDTYIFNQDDTYRYTQFFINGNEILSDIDESGKILSYQEISNGLFKITLDKKYALGDLYKYKNMIGTLEEVNVPSDETFELHREDGSLWFDKNGQYHSEYNDKGTSPYVRKNNVIYLLSKESEDKYIIKYYITDSGIFTADMYKEN